ncbi:hypothetical protein [Roseateles koreensis]|uniref:MORN repeat-containing protein n=1 Tax=Roseateles koreensis TaxID=2987526 RepID=A0ABT5KYZ1_9BURK|nr:hypothetical protein [Roseateles koreensis]MDC8787026.1 hypothetical protein [Roseateles koreensis]
MKPRLRTALWLVVPLLGLALPAQAQPVAAPPTPAATAASATSSSSATPDAAASAAPPLSCTLLTAKAMSADLRAALARSLNKDLEHQAQLLDDAIQLWTQGVAGCEGRALERAQRNLADLQIQRAAVAERLSAGSQCETSHRDAAALQDLARQAFGDRRWPEAASLYAKAETMWELAAEQCTGSQQQLAQQRREQAEVDAHNAEHCAPLFDRARDTTQKFRNTAAGLTLADRQQQSQIAETLWHQAASQCKGSAQELAANNAQALARERGTPWVSTAPMPAASVARPSARPPAGTASAPPANALLKTVTAAAAAAVEVPSSTATGAVPAAPQTPAGAPEASTTPATAAPTLPSTDMDIRTGDTRYLGRFVREPGQVVSGTGRVEWANGDVYIGPLLHSVRQGRGEFIWANGQRYVGDWVQDHATGQGLMRFANGNQWEGQVIDGVPEGEGQMNFSNGDVYKGQVLHSLPNGRGTFRWANSQTFEGDWVNDHPQGRGVLRYANGNRYEGGMANGQPQGKGSLLYANGDRYEGDFEQGKSQGQGSYFWKSGEHYVGAWLNGLKHGKGIYYWANGDRWEGEFKNDESDEDAGQTIRKE